MRAAVFDRAKCMRVLIDAGADMEARDSVRRRSLLRCFCCVKFVVVILAVC